MAKKLSLEGRQNAEAWGADTAFWLQPNKSKFRNPRAPDLQLYSFDGAEQDREYKESIKNKERLVYGVVEDSSSSSQTVTTLAPKLDTKS